ncbi:hypothetical protein D3C80_1793990 [compost metagenome]
MLAHQAHQGKKQLDALIALLEQHKQLARHLDILITPTADRGEIRQAATEIIQPQALRPGDMLQRPIQRPVRVLNQLKTQIRHDADLPLHRRVPL